MTAVASCLHCADRQRRAASQYESISGVQRIRRSMPRSHSTVLHSGVHEMKVYLALGPIR